MRFYMMFYRYIVLSFTESHNYFISSEWYINPFFCA